MTSDTPGPDTSTADPAATDAPDPLDAIDGADLADPAGPPDGPGASRRPTWKKVVERGFYLLFVVFIVYYLASVDYSTFEEVQPSWWALGVATVLAMAFRFWGAFIWTTLLRSLGAHDVRLDAELLYVYAKSWLGRYIPGTAPWLT